jgi:hypothetical protein
MEDSIDYGIDGEKFRIGTWSAVGAELSTEIDKRNTIPDKHRENPGSGRDSVSEVNRPSAGEKIF